MSLGYGLHGPAAGPLLKWQQRHAMLWVPVYVRHTQKEGYVLQMSLKEAIFAGLALLELRSATHSCVTMLSQCVELMGSMQSVHSDTKTVR